MATLVTGCMDNQSEHDGEITHQLMASSLFAGVGESEIACLVAQAREVRHGDGTQLAEEHDQLHEFLILLQGRVRIVRTGSGKSEIFHKVMDAPAFMGEIAILSNLPNMLTVTTVGDTVGLHVSEEGFWNLMATCPNLRAVILREMSFRTRGMAAMNSQQEKLATLGTMTAGLLHELNNPGAAAKRAASQLRENLNRLHLLARGFSERGHTEQQRGCLTSLQERVLSFRGSGCMDSLQQADAEEAMATWIEDHGMDDAWSVAPTLVASGLQPGDLECLSGVFPGSSVQEPVHWLEATASSMQQVSLVEESVSRVHDLARAAKNYVHEGQGGTQTVHVNESLHSTLVILKHKMREKDIHVEKQFGANLPPLTCVCSGLNQIWTNLLDNAIDAVPAGGHIRVRTWQQDDNVMVGIGDDGPGIPPEDQERIFDPFFTTKPAGVGTGMGLGIVQRIADLYHGQLSLHSTPGDTEFVVRIPVGGEASR